MFALCVSHETFLIMWYYVFAALIKAHYTVESVAVKVEINTMSVVLGMGEISQCKAHISDAARVVFIQLFLLATYTHVIVTVRVSYARLTRMLMSSYTNGNVYYVCHCQ